MKKHSRLLMVVLVLTLVSFISLFVGVAMAADTAPPVLTNPTVNPSAIIPGGTVTLFVTVADSSCIDTVAVNLIEIGGASSVLMSCGGCCACPPTNCTYTLTVTVGDTVSNGLKCLGVTATDNKGNTTTGDKIAKVYLLVDTIPPTTTFTSSTVHVYPQSPLGTLYGTVTLQATEVSDTPDSTMVDRVDFYYRQYAAGTPPATPLSDWTFISSDNNGSDSWRITWNTAGLTGSNYWLKTVTYDKAGNEFDPIAGPFIIGIDTVKPVVAKITATPTLVNDYDGNNGSNNCNIQVPNDIRNNVVNLTIDFTETGSGMDTSLAPIIRFYPNDGPNEEAWQVVGNWSDTDTWRGTATILCTHTSGWAKLTIADVRDIAGNIMNLYSKNNVFEVDTVDPTVTTLLVTPNPAIPGSLLKFTVNMTDLYGRLDQNKPPAVSFTTANGITVTVNRVGTYIGGVWQGEALVPQMATDGTAAIKITDAGDTAGNIMANDTRFSFVLDTNKPTSTVTAAELPPYTSASPIQVNFRADDGVKGSGIDTVKLWYRVKPKGSNDFGNWINSGLSPSEYTVTATGMYGKFRFSPPAGEGTYEFYTVAKDKAGNEEEVPFQPNERADDSIIYDTTKPMVAKLKATPDPVGCEIRADHPDGMEVTIQVTFGDDGSGIDHSAFPTITFTPSGSSSPITLTQTTFANAIWTGTAFVPCTSPNGPATVNIVGGKDLAGNILQPYSKANAFIIDTVKPRVTNATAAPNPAKANSTITITVSFTDETSGLNYGIEPVVEFAPVSGSPKILVTRTSYTGNLWMGQAILPSTYNYNGEVRILVSEATDEAGNKMVLLTTNGATGTQSPYNFKIDVTKPLSRAICPPTGYASGSVMTVEFTASDTQNGDPTGTGIASTTLYYRVNPGYGFGGWTNSGLSLQGSKGSFSFIPSGGNATYEFYTIAADGAGNVEAIPANADCSVIYTSAANPAVVISSRGNMTATTGDNVAATAAITDNLGITSVKLYYTPINGTETEVIMTESPAGTYNGTIVVANNKIGEIKYYLVVKDTEGNLTREPVMGTYKVTVTDDEAPQIAGLANTAATTGEGVTITGTLTDNVGVQSATLYYTPIGGVTMPLGFSSGLAFVPAAVNKTGSIPYYVVVSDGVNQTTSATFTITVTDNDNPTLQLSGSNPQTAASGDTVILRGSFTDNIAVISAQLDYVTNPAGGIITPASGSPISITFGPSGDISVQAAIKTGFVGTIDYIITVKDAAANSDSKTAAITVSDKTAPVISNIVKDPAAGGTTGDTIAIFATITDNVGVTSANLYWVPIDGSGQVVSMMPLVANVGRVEIPVASNKVGEISFWIVAADAAGNTKRDPVNTLYVHKITVTDNDAPQVTLNPAPIPDLTTGTGNNVTIGTTVFTDNIGITSATLYYTPIGGSQQSLDFITGRSAIPVSATKVGTITYYAEVKDAAGNTNRLPVTGNYKLVVSDDDAPVVILSPNNPSKANSGQSITLAASISDNIGIASALLSWLPPVAISSHTSPIDISSGSKVLTISSGFKGIIDYQITARDAAGNATAVTGQIVVGDVSPPLISNVLPGDNHPTTTSAGSVPVTAYFSDNISLIAADLYYIPIGGTETKIQFSTSNQLPVQSTSGTAIINIPNNKTGEILYYLRATDNEGNSIREPSSGYYKIIVTDNQPPTLILSSAPNAATTGEPVTITAQTLSDNVKVVSANLYYTPIGGNQQVIGFMSGSATIPIAHAVGSPIPYRIEVRDAAGNTTQVGPFNLNVTDNDRPVITLDSLNPATANSGQAITLRASALSDNIGVASATLTYTTTPADPNAVWPPSGIIFISGQAGLQISPSFEGTINYQVTVSDAALNTAAAGGTVTVKDITQPVVTALTGNISGTTGDPVIITATASDNKTGTGSLIVRLAYSPSNAVSSPASPVTMTYDSVTGQYSAALTSATNFVGNLTYHISATDAAGNIGRVGPYTAAIADNDPPVITLDPANPTTGTTGEGVTIKTTKFTDNIGITRAELHYWASPEVVLNFINGQATIPVNPNSVNTINFYVIAWDAAGNSTIVPFSALTNPNQPGNSNQQITVTDNDSPVLNLAVNNPTQAVSAQQFTIAGSFSDNIGVASVRLTYQTNPAGGISGPGTIDINPLAGSFSIDLASIPGYVGAVNYTVTAADAKGNTTSRLGTVNIIKDTQLPTPSSVTASPAVSGRGLVTITINFPNGTNLDCSAAPAPVVTFTPPGQPDAAVNQNVVCSNNTWTGQGMVLLTHASGQVKVDISGFKNVNGNMMTAAAYPNVFVIDVVDPVSTASSPAYGNNPNKIEVNFTVNDARSPNSAGVDITRLWYRIKPGTAWIDSSLTLAGTTGTFNFTPVGEGTYEFYTQSRDKAANTYNVEGTVSIEGSGMNEGTAGWSALLASTLGSKATTVYDLTPPASKASAPAKASSSPITVGFTASDPVPASGVVSTQLWYIFNNGTGYGPWKNSGLTSSDTAGTFRFSPADGEGTYGFYTLSVDKAGNKEAVPNAGADDADALTVYGLNIDLYNPRVSGVTIIPDPAKAGQVKVTINFTDLGSEINTAVNPTVVFRPAGSLTTMPFTGNYLAKTTTWKGTATVQAGHTNGQAALEISGAKDNYGNIMNPDNTHNFIIDTQLPASQAASAPGNTSTSPIPITFTANDPNPGTEVVEVALYYRVDKGTGFGNWRESGVKGSGNSGTLYFLPADGDGEYDFYTVATDGAANREDTPTAVTPADKTTIFNSVGPLCSSVKTVPNPAGAGSITVTVTFAQGSNLNYTKLPTVTFTPAGSINKFPVIYTNGTYQNSTWIGIANIVATHPSGYARIDVSGATDLNGVVMSPASYSNVFVIDVVTPSSTAFGPKFENGASISLNYQAQDIPLPSSGINEVKLFYRFGTGGNWQNTYLNGTTAKGSLTYTPQQGDGTYQFITQAVDKVGNEEAIVGQNAKVSVIFDHVASSSSATSPPTATSSPITVSFEALDATSGVAETTLWYRVNTGPGFGPWLSSGLTAKGTSGSFAFIPYHGEGTYQFYTVTVDQAGNVEDVPNHTNPVADSTTIYDITTDTTKPAVMKITASPNPAKAGNVVVTVDFLEAGSGLNYTVLPAVTFTSYQGNPVQITQNIGYTGYTWIGTAVVTGQIKDGPVAITVSGATDNMGNEMTNYSSAQVFLIDNTRPVLDNLTIAPKMAKEGQITVTAYLSDAGSGLNYTQLPTVTFTPNAQNPILLTPVSYKDNILVAKGTIDNTMANSQAIITVKGVFDPAGNEITTNVNYSFVIDTVAPTSQVTALRLGSIKVDFTAGDPGGVGVNLTKLWYRLDPAGSGVYGPWTDSGLTKTGTSGTFIFNPPADGSYDFYTQSTDLAGNAEPVPINGQAGNKQIDYNTTGPDVKSVAVSPDPAPAGLITVTVTFKDGSNLPHDPNQVNPVVTFIPAGQGPITVTKNNFFNNVWTGTAQVLSGHANGKVTIKIKEVVDIGGQTMPERTYYNYFTIDTIPPEVLTAAADPNPAKADWVNITITFKEVMGLNYNDPVGPVVNVIIADGASIPVTRTSYSNNTWKGKLKVLSEYQNGPARIDVQLVSDLAGNTLNQDKSNTFTIDTRAPISQVTKSPAYSTVASIPVEFKASDAQTSVKSVTLFYRYRPTAGSGQFGAWTNSSLTKDTSSGSFTFVPTLGQGEYQFYTLATDAAGNQEGAKSNSEATTEYDAATDTIKPLAKRAIVSPDPAKAGPVTVVVEFIEEGSGLDLTQKPTITLISAKGNTMPVTVTQYADGAATGTAVIPAGADGPAKVEVSGARDRRWNEMNKAAFSSVFTIDTISPQVKEAKINPNLAKAGEVRIRIEFSDSGSGLNPGVEPAVSFAPAGGSKVNVTKESFTDNVYLGVGTVLSTHNNGKAVVTISGAADLAGNTIVTNSSETFIIDTIKPASRTLPLPEASSAAALKAAYEASDENGSGVKSVDLWYRVDRGEGFGVWKATGLTKTAAADTFTFILPDGDGTYEFATVATDVAGNREDTPTELVSGDSAIIYDVTPPMVECERITVSPGPAAATIDTGKQITVTIKFAPGSNLDYTKSPDVVFTPLNQNPEVIHHVSYRNLTWVGKADIQKTHKNGRTPITIQDAYDKSGNKIKETICQNAFVIDTVGPQVVNYRVTPDPANVGWFYLTLNLLETEAGIDYSDTPEVWIITPQGREIYLKTTAYYGNTWKGTAKLNRTDKDYGTARIMVSTSEISGPGKDLAGNYFEPWDELTARTFTFEMDTVLPVSRIISTAPPQPPLPEFSTSAPIYMNYEASDLGSGIKSAALWYRVNKGYGFSPWKDSGLTLAKENGTFAFTPKDGDGRYEFYTLAADKAGNIEPVPGGGDEQVEPDTGMDEADAWTIYDITLPKVKNVTVTPSPAKEGTVKIQVEFENLGSGLNYNSDKWPVVTFTPKGGSPQPVTPFTYSENVWKGEATILGTHTNGEATINITGAVDRAGFVMSTNNFHKFTIDTVKPRVLDVTVKPDLAKANSVITITINFVETESGMDYAARPRVTFTPADGNEVMVDQKSYKSNTWIGTAIIRSDFNSGKAVIKVSGAQDNARNVMDINGLHTFTIDSKSLSSVAYAPQYATAAPIKISFTATDDYSGVQSTTLWYRVNPSNGFGEWTNSGLTLTGEKGIFLFNPPVNEAVYEFYTVAVDKVGNEEEVPITADGETQYSTKIIPARISDVSGDVPATTGEPITISATVTDAGDGRGIDRVEFYYTSPGKSEQMIVMIQQVNTYITSITPAINRVGIIPYYIKAIDAEQNVTLAPESGAYRITVTDNDKPTIQLDTRNLTSTTTGESVIIRGSVADNIGVTSARLYYTLPNGEEQFLDFAAGVATIPVAIDNVGSLTYYICVADAAGNKTQEPISGVYTIIVLDDDPPLVTMEPSNPTMTCTGKNVTIKASSLKDNDRLVSANLYYLPIDGVGEQTLDFKSGNAAIPILEDRVGVIGYYVKAVDASGNITRKPVSGTYSLFVKDCIPPVISNATGDGKATTGDDFTVSAIFTDNIKIVEASVHYTPIDQPDPTLSAMPLVDGGLGRAVIPVDNNKVGEITYYITAADSEGNPARDPVKGVYVITVRDDEAPQALLDDENMDSTAAGEDVMIKAGLSDNIGVVEAKLCYTPLDKKQECLNFMSGAATIPVPKDRVGVIHYFIEAADAAGNINRKPHSGVFTLTVLDGTMPRVVLDPNNPKKTGTGEDVVIKAKSITDDVGVVMATLYYTPIDEVEQSLNFMSGSAVIPVADDKVGQITYYVKVRDAEGNTTREPAAAVKILEVVDKVKPVVTMDPTNAKITTTGEDVTIRLSRASDNIALSAVTLYYTPIDGKRISVDISSGGARIPAASNKVGDIAYYVEAEDRAGNVVRVPAVEAFTLTVLDNDKPTIDGGVVPGNMETTTGERVKVTAEILDNICIESATLFYTPVGEAQKSIDLVIGANGHTQSEIPVSERAVGQISYFIVAADKAGNTARKPDKGVHFITVTDNDRPALSLEPTNPKEATTGEDVAINIQALSDNIKVKTAMLCYKPIGGMEECLDVKRGSAVIPIASDRAGVITYYVEAIDEAGNSARVPAEGVISLPVRDNDKPRLILAEDNPTKGESGGLATIKGQFDDNIGVTSAKLTYVTTPDKGVAEVTNSVNLLAGSGKWDILIDPDFTGRINYTVIVEDAAKNSDSKGGSIQVTDGVSPVIKQATGSFSATTGEAVAIEAVATDDVKIKSVKFYYLPVGAVEPTVVNMRHTPGQDLYSESITIPANKVGEIRYYLIASDGGNETREPKNGSFVITVKDNDLPTVTLGAVLKETYTGGSVEVATTEFSDNIGITSAMIYYTPIDGQQHALDFMNGKAVIPAAKDKAGLITYYIEVKDAAGNMRRLPGTGGTYYDLKVKDNIPPALELAEGNPKSARSGDRVTIKGVFNDNIKVVKAELTYTPVSAVKEPLSPVNFIAGEADLVIHPDYVGDLRYTVTVYDEARLSAEKKGVIHVSDGTGPGITQVTGDVDVVPGQPIEIKARVVDNIGVDTVKVVYTSSPPQGISPVSPVLMRNDGSGNYFVTLTTASGFIGKINYQIVAIDVNGNESRFPVGSNMVVKVEDVVPPKLEIVLTDSQGRRLGSGDFVYVEEVYLEGWASDKGSGVYDIELLVNAEPRTIGQMDRPSSAPSRDGEVHFKTPILLNLGENQIKVTAIDGFGNRMTILSGGEPIKLKFVSETIEQGICQEGGMIPVEVEDIGVTLIVPSGGVKGCHQITIKPIQFEADEAAKSPKPFAYSFEAKRKVGAHFEPEVLTFEKPARLIISYSDLAMSKKNLSESELAIFFYDGYEWIRIESEVDAEGNIVSGRVDHFTKFALMAATKEVPPTQQLIDNVIVVNNPFSPKKEAALIEFDTVRDGGVIVTIRIYNTIGELVRTLVKEEQRTGHTISYSWNGRDDGDNLVENGIYLYQIRIRSGHETDEVTKAIGVVK